MGAAFYKMSQMCTKDVQIDEMMLQNKDGGHYPYLIMLIKLLLMS